MANLFLSGFKVGKGGRDPRFARGLLTGSDRNDRIFEVLVTHICIYLAAECRNHSENLTNRKLSIFYIEVMNQLFFQLRRKKYFFHDQKYFSEKIGQKIFS